MPPAKRICVIGAGRWGVNHIRELQALGVLAGIVDTDLRRLVPWAEKDRTIRTFSNVEAAMASGFDGYVVATPAVTHFEIGAKIIAAGKPVLIEKPLALKASEARQLKAQADRVGVSVMVGHLLLFHPGIVKIQELLVSGALGRIQYLYSNRLNLGTVREEENILWSFAPHDIAIFQYLIGKRPLEVVSRGGSFIRPGIHDTTTTMLAYPDNILGQIFVSWLHPFKEHRLVIIGSKAMVSLEDSADGKPLLLYEKGMDLVRDRVLARNGPSALVEYERTSPLSLELKEFLSCVEGRKPARAGVESGIEVLEILEEASKGLLGQVGSGD